MFSFCFILNKSVNGKNTSDVCHLLMKYSGFGPVNVSLCRTDPNSFSERSARIKPFLMTIKLRLNTHFDFDSIHHYYLPRGRLIAIFNPKYK